MCSWSAEWRVCMSCRKYLVSRECPTDGIVVLMFFGMNNDHSILTVLSLSFIGDDNDDVFRFCCGVV